jgi:hypothetical protein
MADGESRTNHVFEVVKVPSYGHLIEAARDTQDGSFYVAIRRACENLGIDSDSQLQKLKDHHWATTVKIAVVAQDVKQQEPAFLPLAQVPAWLTHINPNKIADRPELAEKLRRYQVEAVDVLYRHFIGPQQGSRDPILAMLEACRAQRQAQLALEGRVDAIQRHVGDLVVLRTAALRALGYVPRAEEPAAPLSTRARVNMLVRTYVAAHGVEYQDVRGEPAAIIRPVIVGAVRPDLPSILTPLAAEFLKGEPPGTDIRGGLELPVEVMGDAVERLVEIAGAIQRQDALAGRQLDAARLANQLPEPDHELYARAGEFVATEVLGGALDAPPRLEEMSHDPPRCPDPAKIAEGPIRRGSSPGDDDGPRAVCRRRIRPGPGPCRRRRASSSRA